ncbi:hypothetical protein ACFWF7_16045 [Nocardia sp. NPDC060256]|uniref:hypothetical protein n=1 Tax=unclassified Nocardia TaxID=2637762 RepID=UPI00365E6F13
MPTAVESGFGRRGVTSLVIQYLQLEIDIESGRALHIWGLHYQPNWSDAEVRPQDVESAVVTVRAEPPLIPGVSIGLDEGIDWKTEYDRRTGWVRVSRYGSASTRLFEIATGTLVGLDHDELASVWIHPEFTD